MAMVMKLSELFELFVTSKLSCPKHLSLLADTHLTKYFSWRFNRSNTELWQKNKSPCLFTNLYTVDLTYTLNCSG